MDTTIDHTLEDQIDSAIRTNPYLGGKRLRFETHAGEVILEGVVATYFQKQMAQESLRHIAGVRRIDNRLHVSW